MKNIIFIDTSFIIAVLNTSDQFHKNAIEIYKQAIHEKWNCVLTEFIIIEAGNFFSKAEWKYTYSQWINSISDGETIFTIIPLDKKILPDTIKYFQKHNDKDWRMIDCISFITMIKHKITDALTFDHHFEQAGFINRIKNF